MATKAVSWRRDWGRSIADWIVCDVREGSRGAEVLSSGFVECGSRGGEGEEVGCGRSGPFSRSTGAAFSRSTRDEDKDGDMDVGDIGEAILKERERGGRQVKAIDRRVPLTRGANEIYIGEQPQLEKHNGREKIYFLVIKI
jgi:hypothetical protein